MNATTQKLIAKYVATGDDHVTAWFWANNPSNPESPKYDKKQAEYCVQIQAKLTKTPQD